MRVCVSSFCSARWRHGSNNNNSTRHTFITLIQSGCHSTLSTTPVAHFHSSSVSKQQEPQTLTPVTQQSVPPSSWLSSPSDISPRAAARIRARYRRHPAHHPLQSSMAYIDEQQQLHYITTPSATPQRKYQLHVPALATAYSFRIQHATKEYIHQACLVFEQQANKLNLYLRSCVPLPTKIKRWAVLRSPHVHKTSVEHYEIRIHKRLLTIDTQSDEEDIQIIKLTRRCHGMIQPRVTRTVRIPAHTPIHTLTFRKEKGRIALEDELGKAGEFDPFNPDDAFDEEDIGLELTEEDEMFGEEDLWQDDNKDLADMNIPDIIREQLKDNNAGKKPSRPSARTSDPFP